MNIFLLFLLALCIALIITGSAVLIRLYQSRQRFVYMQTALTAGHYREVLDLASEQLKVRKSFMLYYYIARAYEGLQDFPMALRFYEDSITYFPQEIRRNMKIEILGRIGDIYSLKKDYIKASANYLMALRENPTDIKALYQMADIYYKSKNFQKAISNLEKIVKIKPDYWRAFTLMGKSYFRIGNYRKAIYSFESALKLNITVPDEKSEAYFLLADAYTNMKNYKESINVLKTLLEDKEYFEEALLKILRDMLIDNQMKEAIKTGKAYVEKLSPTTKNQALYMLGRAYFNQGDYLEAIDCWVEAYQINPDFADLKDLIARYKILIETPALEDYYTEDEKNFNDFIYNYFRLHSTQIIISYKNFKIFREGNIKCHVFYRIPYAMNLTDFKKIEETLMAEHSPNLSCIIYSLFGLSPECKEYGFYKQVQEISSEQFVQLLYKKISPKS
jgi:tetratricopeptide (TPR) repeat protein